MYQYYEIYNKYFHAINNYYFVNIETQPEIAGILIPNAVHVILM